VDDLVRAKVFIKRQTRPVPIERQVVIQTNQFALRMSKGTFDLSSIEAEEEESQTEAGAKSAATPNDDVDLLTGLQNSLNVTSSDEDATISAKGATDEPTDVESDDKDLFGGMANDTDEDEDDAQVYSAAPDAQTGEAQAPSSSRPHRACGVSKIVRSAIENYNRGS
jgi:hypothetical protein